MQQAVNLGAEDNDPLHRVRKRPFVFPASVFTQVLSAKQLYNLSSPLLWALKLSHCEMQNFLLISQCSPWSNSAL
jgi:hypothetical protein